MTIDNYSTSSQTAFGFAGVMLIMIIICGAGLITMYHNSNDMKDVFVHQHDITQKVAKLRSITHERLLLSFLMLNEKDPFELDEILMLFRAKGSDFLKVHEDIKSGILTEEQMKSYLGVMELIRFRSSLLNQAIAFVETGETKAAESKLQEIYHLKKELLSKSNGVLEKLNNDTRFVIEKSSKQSLAALVVTFIVSLAGVVVGVLVSMYFTRIINRKEREIYVNVKILTNKILEENKEKLSELAEVLLDKEVIFKDNLEKIFGKRPFDKDQSDTSEEE